MIELRLCIRMTLLAGCCSALAQMALAAPPTVNCGGMEDVDQFGQMKLDEAKVIECINKGFDPPVSWRPPPGKIAPSQILERENRDSSHHLPRLVFYFNGKSYGRLYQLIDHINDLSPVVALEEHPEKK